MEESLQVNNVSEELEDALKRSLAYWSAESLGTVNRSKWNWRRIGEQGLANAHSTLDQAEGYLNNARRRTFNSGTCSTAFVLRPVSGNS